MLDTHAWLWWTMDMKRLSPRARDAIDGADRIGISAISAWEVALLERKQRIALDQDPARWVRSALRDERFHELPVTAGVAVAAARLERPFHRDPADRIIYATAREIGASLVTRDERLRRFDPARTIW